jgi:hypothetical protein
MLLGGCPGLVSMVLVAQGRGLAAIGIGIIGLFVIVSVVSTLSYRRCVFESANPNWREIRRGELREDGVHVDRGLVRAFFRWDWYSNALAGDDWVAFLPATGAMQPLFVTHSMLGHVDDWQRLLEVVSAIAVDREASSEHQRRQQSLSLMRQNGRPRSIEVPREAIAFAGAVRASDFSRLPKRDRRREKPARSYVVVIALLFSGAFIVTGVSNVVFQQFAFLPVFLTVYLVLAAIGIAIRVKLRGKFSDKVVYFLNAYATESSVVSDFGITTADVAWPAFRLVIRTGDFIALRRQGGQFLLARADMFSDQQQWQRFGDWVSAKSASKQHAV